ncbi:8-amino-7-oxononanoate synthase [Hephaestia sp. GCM10023244]|uniref:8-amino-7-oxononanoate synthase n=1 Tax=unclassified Hephaestia TaxID=2631281 RepID=UPI0020770DE5|nr:8-amino-7-oxononanoate synthase [Hephaestia sp. MAHUQ-44]MCM8730212.1 8-amino-7-oxononanoate synthase [Hephaestia sp. MAHUQ-44]
MALLDPYAADLDRLAAADRRRALQPRAGADFSSNDYLGLADSTALADAARAALARGVPLGAGGSRLLRGNHAEHEALEAEAAARFGTEAALFFANGYAANVAMLSALPQTGDRIFHDALIHASAHDGMRLARCGAQSVPHNDADAFADAIAAWRRDGGTGRPWIVIESLYSMDGDRAPITALADIADANDGFLVIDEAHATGVFGVRGCGLAEGVEGRENVITLHTFGKALGTEGALLCLPRVLADFLVNRGRGFIFSTAPSPLIAAVGRAALRLACDDPAPRARLTALIDYAQTRLARHGALRSGSQILPLILGDDTTTMHAAGALQASGLDVRGIRPPTVPAGTARLRICITLNVDEAAIDRLDAALAEALA